MTGASIDEAVKGRPKHQNRTLIEHELHPRHVSWLDLLPEQAGASMRFVFACLEYGVLEAWQDSKGAVRLYLPGSCGGHLIVGDPGDNRHPALPQATPTQTSGGPGMSPHHSGRVECFGREKPAFAPQNTTPCTSSRTHFTEEIQ